MKNESTSLVLHASRVSSVCPLENSSAKLSCTSDREDEQEGELLCIAMIGKPSALQPQRPCCPVFSELFVWILFSIGHPQSRSRQMSRDS